MRIIAHPPLNVVPDYRRPPKPLQDADLNFLWTKRKQSIEPSAKTLHRFAWQPDNQIRMHVYAGLVSQEAQILLEPRVILASLYQMSYLLIERLYAHFKLQCSGRKFRYDISQTLRQPVRDHFEMKEVSRPIALKKEFQDRFADIEIQVEGSVHELEMLHAALEQALQFPNQNWQRSLADWDVQRRKAELTRKRATS